LRKGEEKYLGGPRGWNQNIGRPPETKSRYKVCQDARQKRKEKTADGFVGEKKAKKGYRSTTLAARGKRSRRVPWLRAGGGGTERKEKDEKYMDWEPKDFRRERAEKGDERTFKNRREGKEAQD